MKPTSRLFLCIRCHAQVVICSKCDRGQIYCSKTCALLARQKALRLARSRYQKTFNGRRKHAACQARYKTKMKNKMMDQGSPLLLKNDSIDSLEKKPENTEKEHNNFTLCCPFCKNQVSDWIRNDFLRRRSCKSRVHSRFGAQAP